MKDPRVRARALLALGAALGVALAVRGSTHAGGAAYTLPRGVTARVGDALITHEEYQRALAAVAADRREVAPDAAMRRHVLNRLIDEELLIQGAVELGLPLRDPRVRGLLAASMLESVVGGADPAPTERALRAYYEAHATRFTRRGRVRVQALYFVGEGAGERAEVASERLLRGDAFESVAREADPPPLPLPSGFVPVSHLAELVGPSVARAVDGLTVGEIAPRVATDAGTWMLRLAARQDGEATPFEDARLHILAEMRREADDARLRTWLDSRRSRSRVVIRESGL